MSKKVSREDFEEILPILEDAPSWDQVKGILQYIASNDPLMGSILYTVKDKALEFREEILSDEE